MDRSGFLKLLASRLYPLLRAQGFRGSGTTLRRISEPIIHVFNVQGSSSATRCYLNLGAHLSFLPAEGGRDVPPASTMEYHCIFRDRINPPPGPPFGFAYGRTPEEAAETVDFIISEWSTQGCRFFERFGKYPESFMKLIDGAHFDQIHARDCLHYARIAAQLGRIDQARAFVHRGLETTPSLATGLRADLIVLSDKLGLAAPGAVADRGLGSDS